MATERKKDHNEEGSIHVGGNKTIFTLHPNDPIPDALIDALTTVRGMDKVMARVTLADYADLADFLPAATVAATRKLAARVTLTPTATPVIARFLTALSRSPDAQPASSLVDTESDTVDGTTDASHVTAR